MRNSICVDLRAKFYIVITMILGNYENVTIWEKRGSSDVNMYGLTQ